MIEEAIASLTLLLQGKIPPALDVEAFADAGERQLAALLNRLFACMQETHEFVVPLSQGKLAELRISPGNFLGSPFKELHSRLLHLTWQAEQVARGDYRQRVDFMGDFSEAFNAMIAALEQHDRQLRQKIAELEQAMAHISRLEGILPICSNCKKVRHVGTDPKEQGNWVQIEQYLSEKTAAEFSHSICPECREKLYPGRGGHRD